MLIVWVILVISQLDYFDALFCNHTEVGETPYFNRNMSEDILLSGGGRGTISCCMNAVSNIIWSFKKNISVREWTIIDNRNELYQFREQNRILLIIKAAKRDEGHYKCTGTNATGATLSGSTEVRVVFGNNVNRDVKIVDISDTTKHRFPVGSTFSLFCISTMKSDFIAYFKWNKEESGRNVSLIKRGTLTTKYKNDTLIRNYRGYCYLNKSKIEDRQFMYNLTLTVLSVSWMHEGKYCCEVGSREKKNKSRINVGCLFVTIDHIYSALIFELIGIIASCIVLLILSMIFYYDLKVVIKDLIRRLFFRGRFNGKYNFLFVYNFEQESEYRIIQNVITDIESRGFSCYFYHRDQTYGKDILDDLHTVIMEGNVIVIWAMNTLWKNPILNFCIQASVSNLSVNKRRYIFPNKQYAVKECQSEQILKDISSIFSSKVFVLNTSKITNESKKGFLRKWNKYRLITWLISSLPLECASTRRHCNVANFAQSYL